MPHALNPRQHEAVSTGGHQLILAGPGSGKTRVITEKILYLLENAGARPAEILALTFSEKAAAEMEERLSARTDTSDLTVSTFHAFCLSVLEENILESGIDFSGGMISRPARLVWGLSHIDTFGFGHIAVGNNAAPVIESIIDGISAFRDELVTPDELEAWLREAGAADPDPETAAELGRLADLLKVYRAYEAYKRKRRVIDFDDMIHETVRLFAEKPLVLERYRSRYRYILVDEFQDTNVAQFALIRQLAGDHLCVVGDDDQTIYRFRGAYFGNFRDFRETFAGHTETLLAENYRNGTNILALALELMARADDREHKPLSSSHPANGTVIVARCEDEASEAEYVRDRIGELLGTPRRNGEPIGYGDIAVLCRKKSDGAKFARTLRQGGIPCEFVGEIDLFRTAPVRDLLAYLRAIADPCTAGISLARIMQAAGVAEADVQAVNRIARHRARDSAGDDDCVLAAMRDAGDLPGGGDAAVREIAGTLDRLIADRDRGPVSDLVYDVMMGASGVYRQALAEPSGRDRAVLNRFSDLAREFEDGSREGSLADFLAYLGYLADFSLDVEEGGDGGAVRIMTIHQSKGREFAAVFLVDMADRKFPLDYRRKAFTVPAALVKGVVPGTDERALHLAEERRLCYVAMTRAEEHLCLAYALSYGTNKNPKKPSRFLSDLAFETNPLVTVVEVPARECVLARHPPDAIEQAAKTLQEQAIAAISGMRLKTALERIVTLEKVRLLSGGRDPGTFDPAAFFTVPDDRRVLDALLGRERPALVDGGHRFSASSLSVYDACPLRYKLRHVLHVPGRPKAAFSLGTAVHAVAELLGRDRLAGVPAGTDRALAMLDRLWNPAGFASRTQEEEARAKAEEMLAAFCAWDAANENTLFAVEQPFRFARLGREITGSIDRIETTPAGGSVVIDFKTGSTGGMSKNRIKEDIQMNLYCLAVREQSGRLPERASLYYLREGRQIDYYPTEETIATFGERLDAAITAVLEERFGAAPSYETCRFCDYTDLCDAQEHDPR